ncbi:MAG: response regulator, partial [Myxococcales bacterium]|nr:response regulator [Myxococcales bacterium]
MKPAGALVRDKCRDIRSGGDAAFVDSTDMGQAYDHKHVLFVDDDPASRRLVERMLHSGAPGARVTCVGDGALALAVLDREPVDLLITDLAMPVLGGIELILRVMNRRLRISLLVVSGQKDAQEESKALAYGALAYFEKPLRADAFISCVCNLLKSDSRPAPLEVVSLAGLARIIGMERKTCALRVTQADQPGLLMFVGGELVDARQAELDGLAAAQRMLAWEAPSVALEPLVRAWKRTIDISLAELLRASGDRRGASGGVAARGRPTLPGPPDFRARRPGEQPTLASLSSGASGPAAAVSPAGPAPAVRAAQVRQPGVAAPAAPSVPSVPPPPILPLRSPPMASRNGTPPAVPSPPVVKVPPRVVNVPTGSSRAPAVATSPRPEVGQTPGLSASPAASASAATSGPSTSPAVSVSAAGSGPSASPTISVSDAASGLSASPTISVSAAGPELSASPTISVSD